jgi:hypothetical protein
MEFIRNLRNPAALTGGKSPSTHLVGGLVDLIDSLEVLEKGPFFKKVFNFQSFRFVAKSPDGVPNATACFLVTLVTVNHVQQIYYLQLL